MKFSLGLFLILGCCIAAGSQAIRRPSPLGVPCGRSAFDCLNQQDASAQAENKALTSRQAESAAFALLVIRSGIGPDDLKKFYHASAAENFHAFGTAILAASELKLDTLMVLDGLYHKPLLETLRSLGASKDAAKSAITIASKEMKQAGESKKAQSALTAKRGN